MRASFKVWVKGIRVFSLTRIFDNLKCVKDCRLSGRGRNWQISSKSGNRRYWI